MIKCLEIMCLKSNKFKLPKKITLVMMAGKSTNSPLLAHADGKNRVIEDYNK